MDKFRKDHAPLPVLSGLRPEKWKLVNSYRRLTFCSQQFRVNEILELLMRVDDQGGGRKSSLTVDVSPRGEAKKKSDPVTVDRTENILVYNFWKVCFDMQP